MKLAGFNVENLFERAKAMNLDSWSDGRDLLNDYAKFNGLIAKPTYSAADQKAMLAILKTYNLQKSGESEYFILRENRGAREALNRKPSDPLHLTSSRRAVLCASRAQSLSAIF